MYANIVPDRTCGRINLRILVDLHCTNSLAIDTADRKHHAVFLCGIKELPIIFLAQNNPVEFCLGLFESPVR